MTNPAPNWGFTKFCAKVVTKISDHEVNHKNVHQIWWQICHCIRKFPALYPFCAYFIINNRVPIGSISGMLIPASGKAGCHAQRKVDLAPPLHVKLTKPAVRSRAKLTADVVFFNICDTNLPVATCLTQSWSCPLGGGLLFIRSTKWLKKIIYMLINNIYLHCRWKSFIYLFIW